jgi:hypothetical protein
LKTRAARADFQKSAFIKKIFRRGRPSMENKALPGPWRIFLNRAAAAERTKKFCRAAAIKKNARACVF